MIGNKIVKKTNVGVNTWWWWWWW